MHYCAERGIPHSRFLDEWNPEDRAKLMAHLLDAGSRCTMCGTADWEWEENPYAYEGVIRHCQGCMIKDAMKDDAQGSYQSIELVSPEEAVRLRDAPKIGPRRRRG